MKKRVFSIILIMLVVVTAIISVVGCASQQSAGQSTADTVEEFKTQGYKPDLTGKNVGVFEGSTSEQILRKDYPEAQVSVFKSDSDAVAALRADKVDYVFLLDLEAINYERYSDDLHYCVTPYNTEEHSIAVNKDKSQLRDEISAVIDEFKSDGTMDEIIGHWRVDKDQAYTVEDVPTVENGPVLKVAITSTREPIAFIMDGKPRGIAVELAERIAYKLGMTVEFSDMDFAGALAAVSSGKCDIAPGMTVTDERKKSVDFTDPYMDVHQMMLAKIDTASGSSTSLISQFKDKLYQTFVEENRWQLIVSGLGTTLLISFSALLFGSLLGAGLCALKLSKKKAANIVAAVYGRIMQGLPVLVILMLLYYVLFAKVNIDAVAVGIIAFSLMFAAGTSEIFKTGIQVIDPGQTEAALASGFKRGQAFRFIVLPQAARVVLPVYVGEFITMLKLTSVVGYIAIQDLTKASDIIRSRTYEAFFPLLVIAVIYFLIIFAFSEIMKAVAHRIDPKNRKRRAKGETNHD